MKGNEKINIINKITIKYIQEIIIIIIIIIIVG